MEGIGHLLGAFGIITGGVVFVWLVKKLIVKVFKLQHMGLEDGYTILDFILCWVYMISVGLLIQYLRTK